MEITAEVAMRCLRAAFTVASETGDTRALEILCRAEIINFEDAEFGRALASCLEDCANPREMSEAVARLLENPKTQTYWRIAWRNALCELITEGYGFKTLEPMRDLPPGETIRPVPPAYHAAASYVRARSGVYGPNANTALPSADWLAAGFILEG